MKTISTKYYGPTNIKGSRIKATDGDNTKWVSYYSGYSIEQNHVNAAKKLKDQLGWTGSMVGGHTKEGMVFIFVDESVVI